MARASAIFADRFSHALDTVAAWLPKVIYLVIVAMLAWKIVSLMQGYFSAIQGLL